MIDSGKSYGLTSEEQTFYRDNGYVLVKNVISTEEAAYFRHEAHGIDPAADADSSVSSSSRFLTSARSKSPR